MHRAAELPITVIDFETTGLFPSRHDRVVEIAAVTVNHSGEIQREFTTLVNPTRDIGPTRIHGLTSEDVLKAPTFEEVAGDLVGFMRGSVAVAAHNAMFEQRFLEAEFLRIDRPLPRFLSLCTMQMAGGGKLETCCINHGLPSSEQSHHALGDARAAARLLATLLRNEPETTERLHSLPPIDWPPIHPSGKSLVTREESQRRQQEAPTYLERLATRLQESRQTQATDGALMAYGALLERVLEDRRVEESEADALLDTANAWGISAEQIRKAHSDFIAQLARAAVADGVVTEAERRDLSLVAKLLGHDQARLESVLNEAAAMISAVRPRTGASAISPFASDFVGKRVCFTGELLSSYKGKPMSRELAEELASKAGLEVMGNVTKKLDFLVVADPLTQSSKATKARQYGVRIIHEAVFWKSLNVEVE